MNCNATSVAIITVSLKGLVVDIVFYARVGSSLLVNYHNDGGGASLIRCDVTSAL